MAIYIYLKIFFILDIITLCFSCGPKDRLFLSTDVNALFDYKLSYFHSQNSVKNITERIGKYSFYFKFYLQNIF